MRAEYKLITCILPKGKAWDILEALKADLQIISSSVHSARGVGRITPLAHRGIGEQTEKEIIKVAVKGDQADAIFEYLYAKTAIDQPHGGLMYMCALQRASMLELPDLPAEDSGN